MTEQEFSRRAIRHGEVLLLPIDELPAGAAKEFGGDEYVVAHSESGHHHVASAERIEVYKAADSDRRFLRVTAAGWLKHLKDVDAHEPKRLYPGVYEVRLKTEYAPFLNQIKRVLD